jgi:hypothetical protein
MPTQELKKDTVLTIKKQSIVFKVNRTDVVTAQPKYDGVVFQLKHGMLVDFTDQFLPTEAKDLICNSLNSFPNANIEVNFDNYKKPVSASVS